MADAPLLALKEKLRDTLPSPGGRPQDKVAASKSGGAAKSFLRRTSSACSASANSAGLLSVELHFNTKTNPLIDLSQFTVNGNAGPST
jgi:hypothetical protein